LGKNLETIGEEATAGNPTQYEIEAIKDKRRGVNEVTGKVEDHFLVKCVDYDDPEDDRWVPRSEMSAEGLVKRFTAE